MENTAQDVNLAAALRDQSSAPTSLVGHRLGKYLIRGELGRGGMGIVLEAEDTVLLRSVAIKLLPWDARAQEKSLERFLREARAAARLNHPNAVTIYEVDQRDGVIFIAMELVRGRNAGDLMDEQGAFPWIEATRIITDVGHALQAVHEAGLIHRDVKPDNIVIAATDTTQRHSRVKLADFGLSKVTDGSESSLSGQGHVAGTPNYMSPEQIRGEPLDARTDVYSLGATYYSLLTGAVPYPRAEAMQVLFAHCNEIVPDPRSANPEVPAACAEIVVRAMAKEPADRYATLHEMLVQLEQLKVGEPGACPTAPKLRHADVQAAEAAQAAGHAGPHTSQRHTWSARQMAVGAMTALMLAGVIAFVLPARLSPEHSHDSNLPGANDGNPPLALRGSVDSHLPPGIVEFAGRVSRSLVTPNRRLLILGDSMGEEQRGRLIVVDLATRKTIAISEDQHPYSGFTALASSSDESAVFYSFSNTAVAYLLRTRTPLELCRVQDGTITNMAVSPNNRRLALVIRPWDNSGVRVELYDLKLTQDSAKASYLRSVLQQESREIAAASFAGNGKWLAVTTSDGEIMLVDANEFQVRSTMQMPDPLPANSGFGIAVVFSPDSTHFAATGGRNIVLWEVSTGEHRAFESSHRNAIVAVDFSPDGQRISSASSDGIRLWDVPTGQQIGETIDGHRGCEVILASFVSDAQQLVSVGLDDAVRLWDIPEPTLSQPRD